MKILFINGHLHVGGVERSLVNILKSFDYSQVQVDLLLVEDYGAYRNEIPEQVRVFYLDLKPTYGSVFGVLVESVRSKRLQSVSQKLILTAANKINRNCLKMLRLPEGLEREYDIAIAYRVGFPLDIVSYAIKAEIKCVWWHHGEFDYSDYEVKKWREAFMNLDHIICVSEASRRMIRPHFPEMESKLAVVPNMVIPNDIQKAANAFNPYIEPNAKVIIVSVGRMSQEKHMLDTVSVMHILKNKGFDNIVWYLVGDGAEREQIERKICEYGLYDHFRLVGNQPNPYPYIKNAHIFVHPSRVESQGLSVLEAMVLEKICVVVRSEGTDEFVQDGHNAFSAEPSVESLAEKVILAINHLDKVDFSAGQKGTVERFLPSAILQMFSEALGKNIRYAE